MLSSSYRKSLTTLFDEFKNLMDQIQTFKKTIHYKADDYFTKSCLTSKDNLLFELADQISMPNALKYVRDSALNQLLGDCRLLQRIYTNVYRPAIMHTEPKRVQYLYYNENNDLVSEINRQALAKKLSENLQRTYVSARDILIRNVCVCRDDSDSDSDSECECECECRRDGYLTPLDETDLQIWDEHINKLKKKKYQRQLLDSLEVPHINDIYNQELINMNSYCQSSGSAHT